MRTGSIKALVNRHIQECGENKKLAYEHAGEQVGRLLETGKIAPESFSLRALFDGLVDTGGQYVGTMGADSIAEAVSTSAFPYITKELISTTLIKKYDSAIGDVASLVTEEEAVTYPDSTIAGIEAGDTLEFRNEGMPYEETQLSEKRAQVRIGAFGRMIALTREMVLFDKTGQLLSRARAVGEKGGLQRAKMIVETLEMLPRSAFPLENTTTLRSAVFDGTIVTNAIFYADTHASYAYMHKQVNDNYLAGGLTTPNLTTAYAQLAAMLDEQGEAIVINPNTLVVHPLDAITAWQLTRQTAQFDTGDRAGAPFGPGGVAQFKVITTPFLQTSSGRDWYLGDMKSQLIWHWGYKPEVKTQTSNSEVAFTNDIVTRYRFGYMGGVAHSDYVYIVQGHAS